MENKASRVLVLRAPSGVSGDMLLAGLTCVSGIRPDETGELISRIGFGIPRECFSVSAVSVEGISGWRAEVRLKEEKNHRTYASIRSGIRQSRMSARAAKISLAAFSLLAQAEGEIHGIPADEVTFHEVGALDSILDICLAASVFDRLDVKEFFCSPLPVCDGTIAMAHGMLASPAPATMQLLKGVPVYGIDSSGETVTPTAAAMLKALGARFGKWPGVVPVKTVRVFGGRIVPNVPNGATFVLGAAAPDGCEIPLAVNRVD